MRLGALIDNKYGKLRCFVCNTSISPMDKNMKLEQIYSISINYEIRNEIDRLWPT